MRSLLSSPFATSLLVAIAATHLIPGIVKQSSEAVSVELASPSSPIVVIIDGVAFPDIGVMPASPPISRKNHHDQAQVELGKQLFFDSRLSKNDKISCSYCHIPGAGFADPHPTSAGIDDLLGGR